MGSRVVMLHVRTDNEIQARKIHTHVNALVNEIAEHFPSVVVSAYDEDVFTKDKEFFDEGTMMKVYKALRGLGDKCLSEQGVDWVDANEIINALQNAGILFRERNQ